jgi:hypothetical protein
MMNLISWKYFILSLWQKKEAFIWVAALIFLAVSDPGIHHYTLCPIDNLGFHYCPGCGLGRSIGYFFQGEFQASFFTHPLGIPAVFLLVFRSLKVILKPGNLFLATIK